MNEEIKNRIRSVATSEHLEDGVKVERLCALFEEIHQTAKEENERLKISEQDKIDLNIEFYQSCEFALHGMNDTIMRMDLIVEDIEQLTQQNKQMQEILNDLHIFFSKVQFCDIEQDDINELVSIARKIPQALGGE